MSAAVKVLGCGVYKSFLVVFFLFFIGREERGLVTRDRYASMVNEVLGLRDNKVGVCRCCSTDKM